MSVSFSPCNRLPARRLATDRARRREVIDMNTRILALSFLAAGSLCFWGCANDTTTTTQTQTDQTTKRVHTQEELRKSGETNPAAALEKTDPAVRMSGPR